MLDLEFELAVKFGACLLSDVIIDSIDNRRDWKHSDLCAVCFSVYFSVFLLNKRSLGTS